MKKLVPSSIGLTEAAQRLRAGSLVVIPTETVYGLAGNAFNARACAQIFALKDRPQFNPLICHLPSAESLSELCDEVPDEAKELARIFWPGPLTLVLKKKSRIPDLVTAGLDTVAVRVPAHSLALDLLRTCGLPLAAPSANRFQHISPTTVEAAYRELGDAVAYLDGGSCTVGLESTILAHGEAGWECLRIGGLALEKIEKRVGPVKLVDGASGIRAPGMLKKHYAPTTPLEWLDEPGSSNQGGLIGIGLPESLKNRFEFCEDLSPAGDLDEAARELFSALRRLDARGLEKIYALRAPERGLGRAINDRLERAAGSVSD